MSVEQSLNKKREWALIALVILAAAFLRFFRLGSQSFWTDEILTIGMYKSPPGGIPFWVKLLWNIHGPLYSLILHFWSMVSSSQVWLRAPSAIAGILSVYFIYRWFVILGRKDLALIGALFLALNPFNLYYSQELRFYSFVNLFIIISLIFFKRFLDNPSAGRGALLGLILALTCLSHFSAVFLCFALFVYMIVTGQLRGRCLRSGALAALIVIILISPWVYREIMFLRGIRVIEISALSMEERLRGELTMSLWSYPYSLYAFSVGYSFGPDIRELHLIESVYPLLGRHSVELLVTALLFGGLFISGLLQSARRGMITLFLSIILVVVLSLTAIARINIKVFNVRYLTAVFPVYIALLVYGLPSGRVWRAVVTGGVCLVMLISDWNYYTVPRYARDDARGAVRIVTELEEEGDLIIAPNFKNTFDYYYSGSNKVEPFPPARSEEIVRGLIRQKVDVHPRIWYVRCRHWGYDPKDIMLRVLSSECRKVETWDLTGIRLILFESKSD